MINDSDRWVSVRREVVEVDGFGPVYPRETRTVTFHGDTLADAMRHAAGFLDAHYRDGEPVACSFFHDTEPVAFEPGGAKEHDQGWSFHLTVEM